MTFSEKLKDIRKRFGLSQEDLAEIMNVSRQAITKWETEGGLPDITNLQELSKIFGVTIDYLLDNNSQLPLLVMKKELDKKKYDNKVKGYNEALKEYFPNPWIIYALSNGKKLNKLETLFDFFTGGDYYLIKNVSDLSPYYLAIKDDLKLLINITDWILEVKELPSDTKIKRFTVGENKFINVCKLDINKE